MGCNSDYMNATNKEKSLSKVACLLDELKGISFTQGAWNGYHPNASAHWMGRPEQDKLVAELCAALKKTDVSKYSLEMQTWWRDHQAADKARLAREKQERKDERDRAAAIAKLTPRERKLLGV